MIDLGFTGNHFTWTNKCKHKFTLVVQILDKFYATPSWIHISKDATVHHLPHIHNDHCPLLLNLTKYIGTPMHTFCFRTI